MEISIPEGMKKSEKWIRSEKEIYEKILKQIIDEHEKNFRKERRVYDRDLAYFIKEKY